MPGVATVADQTPTPQPERTTRTLPVTWHPDAVQRAKDAAARILDATDEVEAFPVAGTVMTRLDLMCLLDGLRQATEEPECEGRSGCETSPHESDCPNWTAPVGGQPQPDTAPDLLREQIYAALVERGLIAPTGQVPYWSERLGCIAWQPANEYALALAGTTLEQPEPQPRPDTPTDLDLRGQITKALQWAWAQGRCRGTYDITAEAEKLERQVLAAATADRVAPLLAAKDQRADTLSVLLRGMARRSSAWHRQTLTAVRAVQDLARKLTEARDDAKNAREDSARRVRESAQLRAERDDARAECARLNGELGARGGDILALTEELKRLRATPTGAMPFGPLPYAADVDEVVRRGVLGPSAGELNHPTPPPREEM